MNILILLLLILRTGVGFANSEHDKPEPTPQSRMVHTDGYVHEWKKFPAITGQNIFSTEVLRFGENQGRMFVAYFIASWCVPCKTLVNDLRNVEIKHKDAVSDFLYIFTHDTKEDAVKFAREYKIKNAIMADHEILKNFKNPELPAVYFSDRKGWLAGRFLKSTKENLQQLDSIILKFSVF